MEIIQKAGQPLVPLSEIAGGEAFSHENRFWVKGNGGEQPSGCWCYCTDLVTGEVQQYSISCQVCPVKIKLLIIQED